MRTFMTRTVGVIMVLAAIATGCGGGSPSQQTADRFMDLYYAHARLGDAAALCADAARTRLDAEIKAVQGVAKDTGSDAPRVTFALTGSTTPSPTTATYSYAVTAHTSDVAAIATTLGLTQQGDHWMVTSITEQHGQH